jgi:two-component system OmpR family sensor kinase
VTGLAGHLPAPAVRRARTAIAVNLAAAAGLVVLLVSAIAFLVSTDQQNRATERYVGVALGQDRGGVKYSCLWLFTMPADRRPGPTVAVEEAEGAGVAPPGFPRMASMWSVAAGGEPVEEAVPGERTVYLVRTILVDGQVRQAVFDLAYQRDNSAQMLTALAAAGLVGLGGAAVLGLALSRRAVRPLVLALDRQQRFVADASHELRAPLTRLHTRAQMLLLKGTDLPAPVADELARMVRGTGELTDVVEDLLRSAQLAAGTRSIDEVDLAAIATDLIAAEAGRLDAGRLTARVQAAPNLPVVAGVETALRRMLSNLLDNSISHSRPGGRIRIDVGVTADGRVELVVADDGAGLAPGDHRRLFARFGHGTAGRGPRHGIGLALVREVVDWHHGTISVTGEPGHGARFTVRLPPAGSGHPPRPLRPRGRVSAANARPTVPGRPGSR